MQRYRAAYPPEFRRQMIDLVRSGRTPEELAREFEPTAGVDRDLGQAGGSGRWPPAGWSEQR
jgi:transposase